MRRAAILVTLSAIAACSSNADLAPFTTDGCSNFPDGTLAYRDLWLECCTEHDRAYWRGGSKQDRERADNHLQSCVAATGEADIARLMLAGVRVGGSPYWPTRFRWGYGWPYSRGYQVLNDAERSIADEMLKSIDDGS
jgi:hypothetical protein